MRKSMLASRRCYFMNFSLRWLKGHNQREMTFFLSLRWLKGYIQRENAFFLSLR